ncbi:hypothetical protein [Treponema pedis]|uniref:hypothetical protein n=1 Tax=Treponema pedis TaxID=409322 RepID=UPI003D1EB6F9
MKRFIFLFSLCAILALQMTSCGKGMLAKKKAEEARLKMEAEKRAEEKQLNDDVLSILDFKGKNIAVPELAGTSWIYDRYTIYFEVNNNGVRFTSDYAEYTMEGNKIIFDFSRIISIYEKWTLDHDVRRMYILFKREIAAAKEELKSPSLTPERKTELQGLIKENERALPYYVSADSLISSEFEYLKKQRGSASTPTDEELKKKAYENVENNFKPDVRRKIGAALRTINPVKGVLSSTKDKITIEKILKGLKEDGMPVYLENVEFVKKD